MNETAFVHQSSVNQQRVPSGDPDEINLLEYIYALVKYKWLISGITLLGLIGGYVIAQVKGPTWVAEMIIAPKEAETQKSPNLSSFGAFSGIVASQLNIGGNASLDKIELLIDSRDFNARMIEKYNLLPALFRYQWPKTYTMFWDSTNNNWKSTFKKPEVLMMGDFLKGKFLKKTVKKNNTMTLEIDSRDSGLSLNLANFYITFLDEDIKFSTRNDAKENVAFLEKQLVAITDPLLREKIQSLIADEIEKTMLVSKEAFRVIDPVYLHKQFKEKNLFPMAFGGGLFFITVMLIVILHAFTIAQKSEEDRILIDKICREILPGKR
jgi:uncharacterized protein involved in exopolysaccharide biosynthesis